jgi:RHS repeat-associated protein
MLTRRTHNDATQYQWDTNAALPQLAVEQGVHGSPIHTYGYGVGETPVTLTSLGRDYTYLTDRLGSVVELTDARGDPADSYRYDPYGALLDNDPSFDNASSAGSRVVNPFLFTGQYLDSETGLYDLRARNYDTSGGRFVQVDPLTADLRDAYVAAYVYASARPTTLTDPSGEKSTCDLRCRSLGSSSPDVVPCALILVILCTSTTIDDSDTAEGGSGISTGAAVATGIASLAAAALSKCIEKYGLAQCTSTALEDRHHIVAQSAPLAAPAKEILVLPWREGVDLPGKIDNPHNIVYLPRYAHWFLHTSAYYLAVDAAIVRVFRGGAGGEPASRARVTRELDEIGDVLRTVLMGPLA